MERVSELSVSRALYRGALFLLVIFILALILHELIWFLMQVFVASIIAAAMTPQSSIRSSAPGACDTSGGRLRAALSFWWQD